MKNKIGTFGLGLIVGITLTAGSTIGAASYLKATPKTVKVVVGSTQKSVEAMNVQNKLYVPVREAGNTFGYSVSGVTSSTVTFAESNVTATKEGTGSSKGSTDTTKGATTTSNNAAPVKNPGGQYVQGLHDKYSTDGKLDANKIKAGIAAGEITVNSQDENGNSILHWVIMEDNFAVYSVIKVNALNVNLVNNQGQTPLHLAVLNQNDFYFGELINYFNIKEQLKDDNGKYPIDYAPDKYSTFNRSLQFIKKS